MHATLLGCRGASLKKERYMFYIPSISMPRPAANIGPLPRPRDSVTRAMASIAVEIGGLVDIDPGLRDEALDGGLLLPAAAVLVVGTTCHRPIGFCEARAVGERTGLDIMLLRFDAYNVSFDTYFPGQRTWLVHCLRWRREGDVWFVPAVGAGQYVRARFDGLELVYEAPFVEPAD